MKSSQLQSLFIYTKDERLNLKQEKDSLEKQLMTVSSSRKRLKELCELLGEDSVALTM